MENEPYIRLLSAYVSTWIDDCALILAGKKLTCVSHRYNTLTLVILGCNGVYKDTLLDIAASILGVNIPDLWQVIFKQGVKKAWEYQYDE